MIVMTPNNVCDKCGKYVPFTLYISKMGCPSERWCLDCIRARFGCCYGKAKSHKKKKRKEMG